MDNGRESINDINEVEDQQDKVAQSHVPQGPFKERCSMKYRLDFVEKLVQHFWNRWTRDIFPNLVIEQKWHVDRRNVEKDDVVLMQDKSSLRGQYKMTIFLFSHARTHSYLLTELKLFT